MPHSIATGTRHLKKLRLALLGAASAVTFAALSSTAQAQIAEVCNSDTNNDFTCGFEASATGGAATAVGDHVAANPFGTAFGSSSLANGSNSTAIGANATAFSDNSTAIGANSSMTVVIVSATLISPAS